MTIKDILDERIVPFEIENEELRKVFSFYLHRAPSIDSKSAIIMTNSDLINAWNSFLVEAGISPSEMKIYAAGKYINEKQLENNHLAGANLINRKTNKLICYKKSVKGTKGREELDIECVLRHIRNSIAHSNVFVKKTGNRIYLLFDDYNNSNHMTARILLSMTIIKRLKKHLSKR